MPKVETFLDEYDAVEMELLKKYGNGLWQVKRGDRVVVRHQDRLKPLDKEAKELLGR